MKDACKLNVLTILRFRTCGLERCTAHWPMCCYISSQLKATVTLLHVAGRYTGGGGWPHPSELEPGESAAPHQRGLAEVTLLQVPDLDAMYLHRAYGFFTVLLQLEYVHIRRSVACLELELQFN
jgi:hypothetical protein